MMRMVEDKEVLEGKVGEVHLGRGKPVSILEIAKAFGTDFVYKFDLPGEAQTTHCKKPYGEYSCDVLDYITAWSKYAS